MKAEVPTAHKNHRMALSSSSLHAFCPLYKLRGPLPLGATGFLRPTSVGSRGHPHTRL